MQCLYIHHLGPFDPVQHRQKGPSRSFQFHQQICSKLQGHLQSSSGHRRRIKIHQPSKKIITKYQPIESQVHIFHIPILKLFKHGNWLRNLK